MLTIRKIAKKTGWSATTVSRALDSLFCRESFPYAPGNRALRMNSTRNAMESNIKNAEV